MRFERLGYFTNSHEENTHAYALEDCFRSGKARTRQLNHGLRCPNFLGTQSSLCRATFRGTIDRKEGTHYIGCSYCDFPDVDDEVLIDATAHYLKLEVFS